MCQAAAALILTLLATAWSLHTGPRVVRSPPYGPYGEDGQYTSGNTDDWQGAGGLDAGVGGTPAYEDSAPQDSYQPTDLLGKENEQEYEQNSDANPSIQSDIENLDEYKSAGGSYTEDVGESSYNLKPSHPKKSQKGLKNKKGKKKKKKSKKKTTAQSDYSKPQNSKESNLYYDETLSSLNQNVLNTPESTDYTKEDEIPLIQPSETYLSNGAISNANTLNPSYDTSPQYDQATKLTYDEPVSDNEYKPTNPTDTYNTDVDKVYENTDLQPSETYGPNAQTISVDPQYPTYDASPQYDQPTKLTYDEAVSDNEYPATVSTDAIFNTEGEEDKVNTDLQSSDPYASNGAISNANTLNPSYDTSPQYDEATKLTYDEPVSDNEYKPTNPTDIYNSDVDKVYENTDLPASDIYVSNAEISNTEPQYPTFEASPQYDQPSKLTYDVAVSDNEYQATIPTDSTYNTEFVDVKEDAVLQPSDTYVSNGEINYANTLYPLYDAFPQYVGSSKLPYVETESVDDQKLSSPISPDDVTDNSDIQGYVSSGVNADISKYEKDILTLCYEKTAHGSHNNILSTSDESGDNKSSFGSPDIYHPQSQSLDNSFVGSIEHPDPYNVEEPIKSTTESNEVVYSATADFNPYSNAYELLSPTIASVKEYSNSEDEKEKVVYDNDVPITNGNSVETLTFPDVVSDVDGETAGNNNLETGDSYNGAEDITNIKQKPENYESYDNILDVQPVDLPFQIAESLSAPSIYTYSQSIPESPQSGSNDNIYTFDELKNIEDESIYLNPNDSYTEEEFSPEYIKNSGSYVGQNNYLGETSLVDELGQTASFSEPKDYLSEKPDYTSSDTKPKDAYGSADSHDVNVDESLSNSLSKDSYSNVKDPALDDISKYTDSKVDQNFPYPKDSYSKETQETVNFEDTTSYLDQKENYYGENLEKAPTYPATEGSPPGDLTDADSYGEKYGDTESFPVSQDPYLSKNVGSIPSNSELEDTLEKDDILEIYSSESQSDFHQKNSNTNVDVSSQTLDDKSKYIPATVDLDGTQSYPEPMISNSNAAGNTLDYFPIDPTAENPYPNGDLIESPHFPYPKDSNVLENVPSTIIDDSYQHPDFSQTSATYNPYSSPKPQPTNVFSSENMQPYPNPITPKPDYNIEKKYNKHSLPRLRPLQNVGWGYLTSGNLIYPTAQTILTFQSPKYPELGNSYIGNIQGPLALKPHVNLWEVLGVVHPNYYQEPIKYTPKSPQYAVVPNANLYVIANR